MMEKSTDRDASYQLSTMSGCYAMQDDKHAPKTTVGEATAEDWQEEIEMMAEELCPTCCGRRTVNPLTAPAGFLCITTTTCPTCEGAGVWL